MSIWSSAIDKLKGLIGKMNGKQTVEQVLHINSAVSSKMQNAIELWGDMYKGEAPWIKNPDPIDGSKVLSLGIPQLIASEKARTALLEFESEITTPMKDTKQETPNFVDPNNTDADGNVMPRVATNVVVTEVPKGPTERAEFLNSQYEKLLRQLRRQIEYGIAKGGLVIKPYYVKHEKGVNAKTLKKDSTSGKVVVNKNTINNEIDFDFIQADDFFPIAFDSNGKITSAAFLQHKVNGDTVYTRLEYHTYTDNTVTVINRAFKTKNVTFEEGKTLGEECNLAEVAEWANFEPKTVIEDVDRLMFAYFKMPEANTIDTYSPLGVSGFDKARGLIEQADRQYSRLIWEFEGSELAVDIDRDALKFVEETGSVMNQLQNRLYRRVDTGDENLYEVFAPNIRDVSLINGLNTILTRIEDVSGLSRGTLSDTVNEAKTATELKILKQRSYQSNVDIQRAIQSALEDVVYIMDTYCTLYDLVEDGEYEVSFEWDDSIITDSDVELSKRIMLMQNGIASKIETRMWYFGETEAQAKEALMKVQQESLENIQINLMQESMLGETPESKKENGVKDGSTQYSSGDNQYGKNSRKEAEQNRLNGNKEE